MTTSPTSVPDPRPAHGVQPYGLILLGLLGLSGLAAPSPAAEPVPAAVLEKPPASSVPAPPDFMRSKPRIPDFTLKDKKEGWYVTGIPLIGSDPDSGFNYGASIQRYDDGSKHSPFFYLGNKFENYFGVGERTLGPLHFPGTPGTSYGNASDYSDALREDRGGKTWRRYNFYDKRQLLLSADLERDYLGGLLRPLVGLQVSHLEARDYSGVEVKGAVQRERLEGRRGVEFPAGLEPGDPHQLRLRLQPRGEPVLHGAGPPVLTDNG